MGDGALPSGELSTTEDFAPVWALGLMSGTSMDGVDAAILKTDGVAIAAFGETDFSPYSAEEARALRAAQGLWPAPEGTDEDPRLATARAIVGESHKNLAARFSSAQVVGFHGQTLAHDPENSRSHQLGDGAALARAIQRDTVWGFRGADLDTGGQGAPLAPVFHWACARWAGLTEPVGFLNLGGVGNLTVVDPRAADPAMAGALLAFDTGPANAPLNDLMLARFGLPMDRGGALAAAGRAHGSVLRRVLQRPFFDQRPPKSLDRHDFHDVLDLVEWMPDADAAATLTALPAACLEAALPLLPKVPERWLVCGGGAQNPTMMADLAMRLPGTVAPVEDIGLSSAMLEAQAFAYLAVRVLRGLPTSFPATTGAHHPVGGGHISRVP